MRLGLVVPGFSAEPSDWCIPALRHLVRELARTDDVRVISIRYPYRAARYVLDDAEVTALGGARCRGPAALPLWRRALSHIAAEHRRRRFDVLHAFWATESGLLAALAGRLLGIPTLVSLSGGELVALPDIGYGDQLIAWERLKVHTSLRLASRVSAGSRLLCERAERMLGRPVQRLPLGVDVDLFAPRPVDARSMRFLHVGTLTPVKDQATLLRAFAELRCRTPQARLTLVGDGPLRTPLQRLAASLDLQDAVCFQAARDHAELADVYAASDVFVLSSRHEAQSMVVLEAAACARAVVGTHVGVVPELGPSVAVGDTAALATVLESALADAAERGRAAHARVTSEFVLGQSVERFRAAYAGLGSGDR